MPPSQVILKAFALQLPWYRSLSGFELSRITGDAFPLLPTSDFRLPTSDFRTSDYNSLHFAAICFKSSFAARLNGRCLGQIATIFRSGLGRTSDRYFGTPACLFRAAIAGTSEMPTPEWTRA